MNSAAGRVPLEEPQLSWLSCQAESAKLAEPGEIARQAQGVLACFGDATIQPSPMGHFRYPSHTIPTYYEFYVS